MDISLLLRIAGIGIIVAVSHQLLKKLEKEEYGVYVSIAGIIAVLLMLITEIATLYETVQTVFGI
jgi:stage III sporulation protein AC